ncbi:MAG: flavin reductase family protein [Bacteroidaceae bacterium]|nr:flavin reductase family protein [Bacteroidaceae bacterium]
MRKDFGTKSWLYPMPVFIIAAYDENGTPNAMNAAWGGIYTDNMIGICISENHKTTKNILATKAFTVSMATVQQKDACDYVGIVTGNKVPDKFAKAGFTAIKSQHVNAPIIAELPMTLECELVSYDDDSCHMVGRIVNVSADESIIDKDGKIDVAKLQPITYDPCNHHYIALGEKVGNAFSDGKTLK